ncbi:hypothetical protein FAES_0379 [Fibrella aestuarina BUZ 2]|uniref:Uncharacterized protein n=1 Tax=Fibrella aestuarina BUZ 2 TaxID=1166018 RepID=I0K2N8_9BACT|nr:hypothetical protein [Fibrella aestuarina]CCG98391.1 hypothetical protein FAES_0379 [Fibrella aestuarina BUZ 2]
MAVPAFPFIRAYLLALTLLSLANSILDNARQRYFMGIRAAQLGALLEM